MAMALGMATSSKGQAARESRKDSGSSSHSPVPPEVIKKTRAVLLSCTKGVLLKRFGKDYASLAGEPFPWRRLGYPNMISLLQAMPEAVHFDYSQKDGDYLLRGVGDKNSFFMPSWQRKTQARIQRERSLSPVVLATQKSQFSPPAQQSSKGRLRRHTSEAAVGDGSSSREVMEYDDKGLVTLFVKWRGSSPQKNLTVLNKILHSHVASVEEPTNVYIRKATDYPSTTGTAFVRFDKIDKAQRVLDRLGKSTHKGFHFDMVPSRTKPKYQSPTTSSRQNGPVRTPNISRQNESGKTSHCKQGTPYKSHDSHVTKEDDTPDTQIQNRFRGLINELDPDDNKSDSDDSSILNYLEWECILDPVPSHSQLISHGPSRFSKQNTDKEKPSSSECISTSCDESCDQSHNQNSPELEMNGDCGSYVTSSYKSHDQSWDIAPLRISEPPPPNENGLILVQVSEVVSPDLLWLQLSSDAEGDLKCISTLIANHRLKPLGKVSVGDYCCIRQSTSPDSSSDSAESAVLYKRAQVEDVRESPIRILRQANILLVDSGVQRRGVPMDDLLELPLAVHPSVVPPVATPCSLHGIESISEGEGWSSLDLQLVWKHLYHKKVFAKETVVPQAANLATTATPSSYNNCKHKTTTVELYLEPTGCVSVVDILVEEGLNMDYATSHVFTTSENGSSSVGSPEPWEGGHMTGHMTKKTQKKLIDLPVVSENGLYEDCFDCEEPLPNMDDYLIKPKNGKECGLDDGHVIPPEFLIGQEEKKSQTKPVSPWQAFQEFCDNYL